MWAAVETNKKFFLCYGLKINLDKMNAVWLGSRVGSNHRICPQLQMNWLTKFKLLGITFDTLAIKDTVFDNLHEKSQRN